MSTQLASIVHEGKGHHVRKVRNGSYEVYRNGVTHAVRCGVFQFSNDDAKALSRAISDCDRRDRETA